MFRHFFVLMAAQAREPLGIGDGRRLKAPDGLRRAAEMLLATLARRASEGILSPLDVPLRDGRGEMQALWFGRCATIVGTDRPVWRR